MSGVGDIIAIITLAVQVGQACRNYLRALRHKDEDVRKLLQQAELLAGVTKKFQEAIKLHPDKLLTTSAIADSIHDCLEELKQLNRVLTNFQEDPDGGSSMRTRFQRLKWPMSKDQLKAETSALDRYVQSFTVALSVDSIFSTLRVESQVESVDTALESLDLKFSVSEQRQLLKALEPVREAAFDSTWRGHEPQCLPGTRSELIKTIQQWSLNPSTEPVFWLCGMAGTGKSTIAQTLAQLFHEDARLAGSYFFSRSQNLSGLTKADRLITTLAYQAAERHTVFRKHLCGILSENLDIAHKRMGDQYQSLLLEALGAVAKAKTYSTRPLVFIIDALDECQDQRDIEMLLALISTTDNLQRFGTKFILTSRPEQVATTGFKSMMGSIACSIKLHDMDKSIVNKDIRDFLIHELELIAGRAGLEDGWIGEAVVERIMTLSESLFIYPATICKHLRNLRGKRQMKQFIQKIATTDDVDNHSLGQLDRMYTIIMENSLPHEASVDEFQTVLGSVLHLHETLTPEALGELLFPDEDDPGEIIFDVLQPMSSVVSCSSQEPITVLHASFRDFLVERSRSASQRFHIDPDNANAHLLQSCLQLMSNNLMKDMCGAGFPGHSTAILGQDVVGARISDALAYACRHWTQHALAKLSAAQYSDIVEFLDHHSLHWIEALGWLDQILAGAMRVSTFQNQVTNLAQSSPRPSSEGLYSQLASKAYDIKRFMTTFGKAISEAPLQTYCSGLAFSPSASFLRKRFVASVPKWLDPLPDTKTVWTSNLGVLEAPTKSIPETCFSTNSRLLLTFSLDGHLCLWDTSSCLLRCLITLRTGGDFWSCRLEDVKLSISSNNALAMLIMETTIYVVDLRLGLEIQKHHSRSKILGPGRFDGEASTIEFLTLDEDCHVGEAMESGAITINNWNLVTNAISQKSLRFSWPGRERFVPTVLMDNLQYLVAERLTSSKNSGDQSADTNKKDIMILDVKTRSTLTTLGGARREVNTVLLSEKHNLVVTAFCEAEDDLEIFFGLPMISIWNLDDGSLRNEFSLSSPPHLSSFSPDLRFIAFDDGGHECLYSTITNQKKSLATKLAPASWGSEESRARHFTSDGRTLALYNGHVVELWNVEHGILASSFSTIGPVPSESTSTIEFSPDNTLLITKPRRHFSDPRDREKYFPTVWEVESQTFDVGGNAGVRRPNRRDSDEVPNGRRFPSSQLRTIASLAGARTSTPDADVTALTRVGLDPSQSWIKVNGRRCIWLPPEFRPTAQSPSSSSSSSSSFQEGILSEINNLHDRGENAVRIQDSTIWIYGVNGGLIHFTFDPTRPLTV